MKLKTDPQDTETIEALESELQRLKNFTNFGLALNVIWSPGGDPDLLGTVKENVIYIFEEDNLKVIDVLRHEFVDYIICEAIKPYMKISTFYNSMFNSVIEKLQTEAYQRKEACVDALVRMFSSV